MTNQPRLLDQDLLDRFESTLRIAGAGIVDVLDPGLRDDEIDQIIGTTDLRLPDEARTWWRWHNGQTSPCAANQRCIVPNHEPFSLQDAVANYQEFQPARALRILSEKPTTYLMCVGTGPIPAPIHQDLTDSYDPAQYHEAFPSFGELLHAWISWIEGGDWFVRPDGHWDYASR